MFRHMVVAVDWRAIHRSALISAALLAYEEGAELTLVCVCDVGRDFGSAILGVIDEGEVAAYDRDVNRALRDALTIVSEFGVNANGHVVFGRPVYEVINAVARGLGADLIVMGTHQQGWLSRTIWGSVAQDVLRDATIPILAIQETTVPPNRAA